MIFNSFTYIIFLATVVALYWSLPRRARLWLLFLASLTFYGFWRVEFVLLLLVSTVTDYWVARAIAASSARRIRRLLLGLSMLVNLCLLGFFKYTLFVVGTANGLAHLAGVETTGFSVPFHIVLPLGISFYTFQSISYTVDVYRGFVRPERDFILFADYVIFFPQLVAGPILRAGEVIWQLDQRPRFSINDMTSGVRRILLGLFMKSVLADNIGGFVDRGFAAPVDSLGAIDVWTLAFLFGFQIYFDFAGYSHVAIGSARLMGIRFPDNFNFPYLATSPRDFWRRWHISLSSWVRDYIYLPVAGARVRDESHGGLVIANDVGTGAWSRLRALWLTWALMGLWHGANWTFVVWGLWHAALVQGQRLGARLSPRLPPVVGWAMTVPLIMLGWLPFRAESVGETIAMVSLLFDPGAYIDTASGFGGGIRRNLSRETYSVAAAVWMLLLASWAGLRWGRQALVARPLAFAVCETTVVAVAISLVLVFLRPIQQFIYFQF